MSNPNKRAAALYRNSDSQQESSIERQKDAVLRSAKSKGYEIVTEYEFPNVPGDIIGQHPDWQRLLRDARTGNWEFLVMDEPSRLNRDDYDDFVADVKRPLKRAGVKVDSVTKGLQDWNTLSGDIQALVDSYKSKEEVRDLSRRVTGTQALLAKQGKHSARMNRYGLRKTYLVDQETGKREFLGYELGPEEEVRVVRFIFDAVGNRRWSIRRVCRELENRGVSPPKGNGRGQNKAEGRWNPGTIAKWIRCRMYVGDLPWNETHQGKYSRWVGGEAGQVEQHESKNKRSSRNLAADCIIKMDVIPAIIDREQFARANATLGQMQKETTSKRDDNSYLFTRILVCGDCGSFLRGCPVRGKKGYICGKYKEYGKDACHRNAILEKDLWQAVLGQVQGVILAPARLTAIETMIEQRLKAECVDGTADRLRFEIDALDRDMAQGNDRLIRLPDDRIAGVVRRLRELEEEKAGKQSKLKELETGVSQQKGILDEAKKQLWRLREAIDGGDEELQAAVVREVISRIEVQYSHERTHGRQSKDGQGRLLSVPARALLYVRRGLGVSLLFTSCCRSPVRCDAKGRANSCRSACATLD